MTMKEKWKQHTTSELITLLQETDQLFYLPYGEPEDREFEFNFRMAILDTIKELYEKQMKPFR